MAKESEIQKEILEFLALKNIFCFRLNTGGFGGSHKGKKWFVRAHSLGKGAADIVAFPLVRCPDSECAIQTPRPCWIECKKAGARPSPEQYSFGSHVTDLGHFYLVARSIEDVALWLSSHQ